MNRSQPAFTLIELLVVISIIALLIGILLPALGSARGSARDMKCLSNLRQIGIGVYGYAQEYKETLPISYFDGSGNAGNKTDWALLIASYMSNDAADTYGDGGKLVPSDTIQCPTAAIEGGRLHYGGNLMFFPFYIANQFAFGLKPYRLYQMKRASEVLWIADAMQTTTPEVDQVKGDAFAALDRLDNYNANDHLDYYNPSAADNLNPIDPGPNFDGAFGGGGGDLRWRHGPGGKANGGTDGAVNGLFGDGHATTNNRGTLLKKNVKADR